MLVKKETVLFKCPSPEKLGDSYPKPTFPPQCRQKFFKGGGGKIKLRNQGEGVEKVSMCKPAQSVLIRISKLVKGPTSLK